MTTELVGYRNIIQNLEVRNLTSRCEPGPVLLKAVRENLPCLFQLLVAFRGLQLHNSNLCSAFTWPFSVLPVSLLCVFYRDHLSLDLRLNRIIWNDVSWRALTYLHLQRSFCLIRSQSQSLGCGHIFRRPPLIPLQLQYHIHCCCPRAEELKSEHSDSIFLFFFSFPCGKQLSRVSIISEFQCKLCYFIGFWI